MANVKAKDISLVKLSEIKPNPKNANKHSDAQIERLSKIIEYQGFRSPLIISNQSGYLVSGHGRLLAAHKLGMKSLPAIYQDFETPDQEYAAMVSDNSIASWAELDLSSINVELPELGPMDLELLGIEDFKVDVSEKETKMSEPCPTCGSRKKEKR